MIDYDVKCQQRPGRFSIDQFHKEPQTHVQRSSFSYIYIHLLPIPIRSETFQGWFLNKTESFQLRKVDSFGRRFGNQEPNQKSKHLGR